jgi:hypothetical protein
LRLSSWTNSAPGIVVLLHLQRDALLLREHSPVARSSASRLSIALAARRSSIVALGLNEFVLAAGLRPPICDFAVRAYIEARHEFEREVGLAAARRRWMMTLWVLLASILVHALLPAGSPLVRTTGSAFSATTAEVSLGPSRKDAMSEAAAATRSPDGPGDGYGPAAILTLVASLLLAGWFGRPLAVSLSHAPAFRPGAAARQPFDARAPPRT